MKVNFFLENANSRYSLQVLFCKMPKQKKILFDDSENEEDGELHINKAYANKYQEWRLSEELQKCMYYSETDKNVSDDIKHINLSISSQK